MLNKYKEHWNTVFSTKSDDEVSWYQPFPATSIALFKRLNLPVEAPIIDVGGGSSFFVDVLLAEGYKNIYVLDISEKAIERAQQRLGPKMQDVNWIVSDVTAFKPEMKFSFWHDRAAFHFLTTAKQIEQYVNCAANAVKPNGSLMVATFSKEGPAKCSGLDVKQYSESTLAPLFAGEFEKLNCFQQNHITPFNTVQNFLFCNFKKR